MSRRRSPRFPCNPLRHLACILGALALVALGGLALGQARAEPQAPGADEPEQTDGEREAGDPADGALGEADELLDPDLCPALFGDAKTRDYNRRVREAKLTWLEPRGKVVEITHTTSWKRPFYLELSGIELVETTVDETGEWSAVVDVDDAVPDCEPGLYPVEPDFALGKQGRIIGVVDGSVLVDFEDRLAYLMTEDAEPPTWQMVWRSGWYFIRRREVTATRAKTTRSRSRSRARSRSRNRNRNRARSRSRRR